MMLYENDQIIEFKVMVRPPKAVNAVWKQMGEMLSVKDCLSANYVPLSGY